MTGTDLDIQQQPNGGMALPSILGGDLPGLALLQQWADANDQATCLVAQWIFTDLVPRHHWPLPPGQTLRSMPNPRVYGPNETDEEYQRRAQIAAASAAGTVLRGMSIGLPPNVALEQMHSIHGTIGAKVKIKYALAISRGIKAWDVELDDDHAICAGIHPTTGDTVVITVTMEQARKAGWTDNAAYGKTPQDMLWARAMGRVLDRVAGHVLFGLPSVEDIEVESRPVEVTAEPAPAPARVTRDAILAAAALSEPVVAQPVPESAREPEVPQVERAVLPVTASQLRDLGDILSQLSVSGTGSKARRLTIASTIAERPLTSAHDLTQDEAAVVIDTLTSILTARDRERLLHELETGEQASDAEQSTADEAARTAEADDYPDPTIEPGWGDMDGAEAAAEGAQ